MTPPTVHAASLAGSGPSLRPYGASCAFTVRTVTPGCTRTRRPSSSTSTPWNALPGVDEHAVGQRLPGQRWCPPTRNVSGTPEPVAGPHHLGDLLGAARGVTTACGYEQVVGRVVGVRVAGRARARSRPRRRVHSSSRPSRAALVGGRPCGGSSRYGSAPPRRRPTPGHELPASARAARHG